MTAPDLTSDGFDFDRISPDLIDRVRNSIERGGQEIQSVDLLKGGIAKSYCDGNIGLEIGVAANWEGKYHEFTCLIVPASVGHDSGGWSIAGGDVNISRLAAWRREHSVGGAHCDSQSNSMLIRSRDFTEKFENVIAADVTIPSRIGLYPSERVIKFWRDLLTPPCLSSGQAVFKVVWTVSEREVSVLALPFSDEKRCGESSLVESVSQISDDIVCPPPKMDWEGLKPLYLQLASEGLRVNLGDDFVGGLEVFGELGLELRYLRARKIDEIIRALETLGDG